MGQQKSTTTVNVPQAGRQEKELVALLQQLAQGALGQFGDLSSLAGGDLSGLGPTGQDQELIAESLGFTGDIARRELEKLSTQSQAQLTEALTAGGQSGSSIESVKRAMLEADLNRQLAGLIDQQRIAGNQALINLPFQRANVALGANQALFQQLAGAAGPALQSLLQGRLANVTQTEMRPFITGGELAKVGAKVAGAL